MKLFYFNLISLLLFASTLTGDKIDNKPDCGDVCPQSLPQLLRPEAGNTYVYYLESNTLINVKETQSVGIKARVEITAHNVCQFSLQLREVQFNGIPDTEQMIELLELNPLEFGSFDGKVLGVCPADNEETWVLNIKKSILSALQMSAKTVTEETIVKENDFSGHCITSYAPLNSDDSTVTTLEKTKSLNECEHRSQNISGFNSRPFILLAEFLRKNFPIIKSGSTCTQQLQNDIIISVICIEENMLSYQESSVVSSSLNLKFAQKIKSTSAKTQANTVPQHLYITEKAETPEVTVESDVLTLLLTICSQLSGDNLSPETTKSFHNLVQSLKSLSESATQRIDRAVKSGEICSSPKLRDLFMDASAFASSDPSIQTIVNAYNNKELSKTRAIILFSLIALKSKPNEKTINALLPLLESKETARPLVLSISLLIRNFCDEQQMCEQIAAVKQSVHILYTKLMNSHHNSQRITCIKSLGNIIHKSFDLIKNGLLSIATNNLMDSGVRVAAIQALTKISDDNIREKLIETLLTDTDEVDVRITAYKSVIMSGVTIEQLNKIVSIKDSNIETYIRTHIENLNKSKSFNRYRVLPQNTFKFKEPTIPGVPFGINRNIQFSYRGAIIETDIIHPKGSLVPSLLSLNVWLPDKDRDLQLFEITIRHVGLDAHIKEAIGRSFSGPEITLRLVEQLIEFIEHLKDLNHNHNTILQLSVRISGKNILFIDTLEDIHIMSKLLIERLKDNQLYTIDRAFGAVLLDSVVEIPTLNGFPMIVHLSQTGVTGVKASLSTEITNSNSKKRKIQSNRSVFTELSAGLNLQVGSYRPGFQYRMQFSLTPFIDVLIESRDVHQLKAQFNLPKEKQSLVKFVQRTRLIDLNGRLKESNEVSDNGQESQEKTRCKQYYGLSICKVSTPLEDSPLPNVEIYVSKIDKSMEAIEFVLEKPPKLSKEMKVWIVRMNATNSQVNNELSAELQLLIPSEGLREARLQLRSPTNSLFTRASILNNKKTNNCDIEIEFICTKLIELNLKYIAYRTAQQRKTELTIDYKLPHSKLESIKLTEKFSLNLNLELNLLKISCFAVLNTTQYPKYNSQIAYYTQIRRSLSTYYSKSELTISWNQELKDKIRILYTSKMDTIYSRIFNMKSENSLIIDAMPFDINYDLKLMAHISLVDNDERYYKIYLVGKDVNGRENNNIDGALEFESTNTPLHRALNATLKYVGREMGYWYEVNQISYNSVVGVYRIQYEKGKVMTVQHEQRFLYSDSIFSSNSVFKHVLNANVSYSYRPDNYSYSSVLSLVDRNMFEYKISILHDAKEYYEWLLRVTDNDQIKIYGTYEENSVELNVDSLFNLKSAQIEIKGHQNYYKCKLERVPKESLTFRYDSTQNSILKELEINISTVKKSSIKLLNSEGLDMKGYIDPISKNKSVHFQIKSPKRGYSHIGVIKYYGLEQKLVIYSNTNKSGNPYITIEGLSHRDRTFLIIKKIKSVDDVSKLEYSCDEGVYALAIDTSRFAAFAEGENKKKKFGKLGFYDKTSNYEHTSNFNVQNGVITIKSISNKYKQILTKLDAVIGLRQLSNITLITPTIDSQLIVNPLGEKKTLNFNWISPECDQKTVIEVIPRNEIKIESLSQLKVEPLKSFKFDALIARSKESFVRISVPAVNFSVRKTKAQKPQYIFNTTLNDYNDIQEFNVNQNLHPIINIIISFYKYSKSYTVSPHFSKIPTTN